MWFKKKPIAKQPEPTKVSTDDPSQPVRPSGYVEPTIDKNSFSCPHCGARSHQTWYSGYALQFKKAGTPFLVNDASIEFAKDEVSKGRSAHALLERFTKLRDGKILLISHDSSASTNADNLWLSKCFSCDEVAIWVYDQLVWPETDSDLPIANPDLPPDIRRDFTEAAQILQQSPRGAAAILRLSVQKLCKHLGQTGSDLNKDIAALVKTGLDVRIQRSLDIVRVIGNNAVHPGQIEMTDNRDVAEKLFTVVNLIAEAMISQPKHIDDLYSSLPQSAREQIERRDSKQ